MLKLRKRLLQTLKDGMYVVVGILMLLVELLQVLIPLMKMQSNSGKEQTLLRKITNEPYAIKLCKLVQHFKSYFRKKETVQVIT